MHLVGFVSIIVTMRGTYSVKVVEAFILSVLCYPILFFEILKYQMKTKFTSTVNIRLDLTVVQSVIAVLTH